MKIKPIEEKKNGKKYQQNKIQIKIIFIVNASFECLWTQGISRIANKIKFVAKIS